MIRAVLDTNVYVAALLSRSGAPARIVTALGDGLFDAIVCPHLLRELKGVLGRQKIVERVDPVVAAAFVDWLERVAIVEPDPVGASGATRDPDDDYLFALAQIAVAPVIVSGDAHVLELRTPQFRTLTPASFADILDGLR